MKIKIEKDTFNIAQRIKDIDRDYYIMFDTEKEKFEVHNSSQVGSSYCLTLPYKELDARALEYVLKTRSQNIENIIEEIEKENQKIEREEETSAVNNFRDSFLDY